MKKIIQIDGVGHYCEVTHSEKTEFWRCGDAEKVAKALKANGKAVVGIHTGLVEVNRLFYTFLGNTYMLEQCDDLLEWFRTSLCGDFTYYYNHVVFNTEDGFISAYADDINNYIAI